MSWFNWSFRRLEICTCGYHALIHKVGCNNNKGYQVRCIHCNRKSQILNSSFNARKQWNILTKARKSSGYEKDGSR